MATASAAAPMDMATLLTSPEVQAAAGEEHKYEKGLSGVTAEEANAKPADAKFKFTSLLSEEQVKDLRDRVPAVAEGMVKDHAQIINFGHTALEKMNQASINMLNEQKHVKIPEADAILGNLLREMDGYSAKHRNVKMEGAITKLKKLFGGAGYTLKTMIRDAKPIASKLDEAEIKVREMEIQLESNAARGRKLHEQTLDSMDDVVVVLAAFEEIGAYLREKFDRIDALVKQAGDAQEGTVEFEGETYSLPEFRELHADYANAVSDVDKSWFDFRTNFFIGFASAPTLRNLILVSASMQRRLHVFRTQGIPAARRSLAMWQQAEQAKQGAELGKALNDGNNKLLQGSFEAASSAVGDVAMAAQESLVTEDTIMAMIDSVKSQAANLVAADRYGREQRARNLTALERGEKEITEADEEGRRQLVANAVAAASGQELAAEPSKSSKGGDILSALTKRK